jgi:hypothetical protein
VIPADGMGRCDADLANTPQLHQTICSARGGSASLVPEHMFLRTGTGQITTRTNIIVLPVSTHKVCSYGRMTMKCLGVFGMRSYKVTAPLILVCI